MDSTYQVLRNLCLNIFMPEMDYVNTKFSFKTVFYRTYYSYGCCACAFEHEYLDYLWDDGDISEETFDKIAASIENGECPHVQTAPQDLVRETNVSAIHIAAAVGSTEAVKHHVSHFRIVKSGIFRLEPYVIAAMKGSYQCVGLYFDGFPENFSISCGFYMLNASRSKQDQDEGPLIKVKRLSFLEFCVEKRDLRLLNSILRKTVSHSNFHSAYELTYKHNLTGIREALMKYDKEALEYRRTILDTGNVREGSSCALPSIVCNQPEVLDEVLQFTPTHKLSGAFKFSLHQTCHVLKRRECQEILLKHEVSEGTGEMSKLSNLGRLLHLFSFYKGFRQETISYIAEIPNLVHAINTPYNEDRSSFRSLSLMGPLHAYIDENKVLDPTVIKAMLDLGSDVDVTDFNGNSPLIHLLKERWWLFCEGFRETLELLIYENPSLYLNRAAVYLGLKQDAYIRTTWNLNFANMPGSFLMDGRMHSLFGHNDADSSALNFIGPLLIECGFPIPTADTLLKARKEVLDPVEVAYIKKSIKEPRSLKLCCRDSLRKHFKARCLHKFVEDAVIPNRLKDYILLKPNLRCIDV